MIAVVQRVSEARVDVGGAPVGQIGLGVVALVAVHADDTTDDVNWMASKLAGLRIFRNGEKHLDYDVQQVAGSMLLVSNFTVAGATRKGRRPSLDAAASPDLANRLFEQLVAAVKRLGVAVATGRFGADMKVSLVNDGPVTFIVNSRENQPHD